MEYLKLGFNDGVETIKLAEKTLTLEQMQALVGGWIQIVTLKDGSMLVMDEEGKLKDRLINIVATKLFVDSFGPGDVVNGDVIHAPKGSIK